MSYLKRYLKVCEHCGVEYRTRSPKQKYCGSKCQHIVQSIQRKTYHICKQCGERFPHRTGENENIFCSRDCAFQWRRDNPKNGFPSYRVHFAQCEICNEWFTSRRERKLCGKRECQLEHNRNLSRASEIRHDQRDRSPRVCKKCGKLFVPEYGNKSRFFCSRKCLRKYHSKRGRAAAHAVRRARLYGVAHESIEPMRILQRDKWKCQLCGIKTPRSRRGTIEDNAPEVDHIIPLALGGTHTYFNLQCTCRKCNIEKGATVKGQLSLAI